jgi:hypothetical protein
VLFRSVGIDEPLTATASHGAASIFEASGGRSGVGIDGTLTATASHGAASIFEASGGRSGVDFLGVSFWRAI